MFVLSLIQNYYIKKTRHASTFVLNKTMSIKNILGYNSGIYSTSTITTTNFYCFNVVNYLNFYITILNSGSETNASGRLLTFKIPLNATN